MSFKDTQRQVQEFLNTGKMTFYERDARERRIAQRRERTLCKCGHYLAVHVIGADVDICMAENCWCAKFDPPQKVIEGELFVETKLIGFKES